MLALAPGSAAKNGRRRRRKVVVLRFRHRWRLTSTGAGDGSYVVRWLAGVTLACGMAAWLIGEPQSALAQSCSTLGIDPVTVTCSNPGGNIGTTNTTNVVS